MNVSKCIVPSRNVGILNNRRARILRVRLVEGKERWEAADHPRVFSLKIGVKPSKIVLPPAWCSKLSSSDNPTPLAYTDNHRDVQPRRGISQRGIGFRSEKGESAPLFIRLKYQLAGFNRSCTNCQDKHLNGRPNEVMTPEMAKKIHEVVLEYRRLKLRELSHTYNKECFSRFITMDETWVHHFTPETKEQSKQLTEKEEQAPEKAKIVPSAGKLMASIFEMRVG
ncbi:mariner transposase [Trichonephila clavipes]|nr:mariner transposase [Trichonephila clavipes]